MNDKLSRLQAAEEAFLKQEFLSPVIWGQPVRVRIAGVVMNLTCRHQGWGVFQPTSFRNARFVRSCSLAERQTYLRLFPVLRLILMERQKNRWLAINANEADKRFRIEGVVPVELTEEVQQFDLVRCRFDGFTCWFDSIEPRHNPQNANYLRQQLTTLREPEKLDLSGLTAGERKAYTIALADLREQMKDWTEERIKEALKHGGAVYRSYMERADSYVIEYSVDGATHRSTIGKNLEVHSAGICLSGQDRTFDLHSLVGVIREGANRYDDDYD